MILEECIEYFAIEAKESEELYKLYKDADKEYALMLKEDAERSTSVAEWLRELKAYKELFEKKHGRIIDESQIRHIECHTERDLYGNEIRYVKTTDAPTIIEGSESE